MAKYLRNRFYFRGATWLGVLNTILAWLFNRVLVAHADLETGEIIKWSVGKGTDFPPVELTAEEKAKNKKRNKTMRKLIWLAMILNIVGHGVVHWGDFSSFFDEAWWSLSLGLIMTGVYTDNDECIDVKISAPVWIVFAGLFVAVPLPATILRDSIWGFIGTMVLLALLVALCVWFARRTTPRG